MYIEKELTDKQIERQDLVDSAIFRLLRDVNPSPQNVVWDIEVLGEIRDVIEGLMKDRYGISNMDFYPFVELEEE